MFKNQPLTQLKYLIFNIYLPMNRYNSKHNLKPNPSPHPNFNPKVCLPVNWRLTTSVIICCLTPCTKLKTIVQ